MKYTALSLVPLLAQCTFAFPGALSEALMKGFEAEKRDGIAECPFAKKLAHREAEPGCPLAKRQAPGVTPPFDAKTQYVSTSGEHAFKAPGQGDLRGPCMCCLPRSYCITTDHNQAQDSMQWQTMATCHTMVSVAWKILPMVAKRRLACM